ncbi:hypothetical protein ACSVDE_02645 [Pseudalkalibacillus sp. Hm43]|uniref:hypothetical protein n=1 Tax=Pseudalkalibacillus sp. Hm43 TaxID=3450742 RepID=UPI003F41D43A
MFTKMMHVLSILLLTMFSLAILTERFPATLPYIMYSSLLFLLFAIGYLIVHYVKRISHIIRS